MPGAHKGTANAHARYWGVTTLVQGKAPRGQKGRNLLTKQNRNILDLGKGCCKITNHVDKCDMPKFNPARSAEHAAQLGFSVWAGNSSSSRPAAPASFPAIARPSLLQLNKTTKANSGKQGIFNSMWANFKFINHPSVYWIPSQL